MREGRQEGFRTFKNHRGKRAYQKEESKLYAEEEGGKRGRTGWRERGINGPFWEGGEKAHNDEWGTKTKGAGRDAHDFYSLGEKIGGRG